MTLFQHCYLFFTRAAKINKKQKFLVEALKLALKCFMRKWLQVTHSLHLKESRDEFCWVTLNANTTFVVLFKFWEWQFPFLFMSHQKYSFLLFLGSIKTLLDLFFSLSHPIKVIWSYIFVYAFLHHFFHTLQSFQIGFLFEALSHRNLYWKEILLMKVHSYPGTSFIKLCVGSAPSYRG